jgi:hypothetical protein
MDPDALDHEHAVLVLDVAPRLDPVVALLNVDLTRLQRARERAAQSAGGRRDDVVERGGLGRVPLRIDAVVLSDLRVDAEPNRLVAAGDVGESLRPAEPLDSNV